MSYQRVECKGCGCILWSDYAKQIKTCPDCENVDSDTLDDLEDKLESLL